MDIERWTDVETVDCKKVGFRVATALRVTGLRNADPGPEYTDVDCLLSHCTGAQQCGLLLPANTEDMIRAQCSVASVIRDKLGIPPKLQIVGLAD